MCFIAIILVYKRPICIDSTVVNKIDRVFLSAGHIQTETAYACYQNQPVNYSSALERTVLKISPVLDRTILLLESIKPFENKLHLIIHEDRPLMYEVSPGKIHFGASFFNLDYHLSRAFIKSWIIENRSSLKIDLSLFEESLADFILYVLVGKIELEDPVDRTRTKLGSVKWPHVIKNVKNYCLSAWKQTEHIEGCNNDFKNNLKLRNQLAATYSLRPLLTSALINSYNEMSIKQKGRLIQSLPHLISSVQLPSDKIVESMLVDSNPIQSGMIGINKFSELVLSASNKKYPEIHLLYSGIIQSLQNRGVSDIFNQAFFDYLVHFDGDIDTSASFYKNLDLAAMKNPEVQVALVDDKNIWLLPSRTALPLTVFNDIQARQTLLMGCESGAQKNMNYFFKKTEKLMLINDCGQKNVYDFDSLFKKGIKPFMSANSKLSFVQLHMPSLQMIHEALPPTQNYFELVKNHNLKRQEIKPLGWSSIHWKKDLQVYRPEAIVDAIEYFRN